jgi:DNA-directed RNA polymerase
MQTFNPKQYLAISIANHYGLDKISWDERIQWVKDNYSNLEDLSDEVLYLKAVKALRDTDKGIPTGYLMDLDATSSGYQIMSLLADDEVGMMETNVLDAGTRKDLYTGIAEEMSKLTGSTITRSDIKKPVMTVGYGSRAQPESMFGKGTPALKAFYKALDNKLPGAMQVMEVIAYCWSKKKTEHVWTLPDGHKVVLPSIITKDYKIESDEMKQIFTYRTEVNQAHENGTNLIANVVHSIDGYIAREMVRMAHKQGFILTHIHDSYWFSPVYGNKVRRNYNIILSRINEMKLLEQITKEITGKSVVECTSKYFNKILSANYSIS